MSGMQPPPPGGAAAAAAAASAAALAEKTPALTLTRTTKGRITCLGSSHRSAVNIASLASNTRSQQPLRTWRPSAPLNTLPAPLVPIADQHTAATVATSNPPINFNIPVKPRLSICANHPLLLPSPPPLPLLVPLPQRPSAAMARHRDCLLVEREFFKHVRNRGCLLVGRAPNSSLSPFPFSSFFPLFFFSPPQLRKSGLSFGSFLLSCFHASSVLIGVLGFWGAVRALF